MTTAATTTPTTYNRLLGLLKEAATLGSVGSAMGWDQEAMMPPAAAAFRAEQLSQLSGMTHELSTRPEIGELLAEAEADATLTGDPLVAANLREIRRDYDIATKLPAELVREIARTSSLGMEAWKEARKNKDFTRFQPWLEKTVELSRRKAECLGVPEGGEMYDALLDTFEPGMTAAMTEELFAPLREFTVDLLATLREHTKDFTDMPGHPAAHAETDMDAQRRFCRRMVEAIGFDFTAGRMDEAAHPFCSGFAPGDTRLTNRYRPDGWLDCLSSGTHEAGHGMYEQGLPKAEHFGSPLGEAISLGIHESQSRMWENQVCRSREFWRHALPIAKEMLGEALAPLDADAVYRSSNLMQPSFIRVESDELTYNLHIMLRFDIERAMLKGDLAVKDVPAAWNERMKADWGLDVPDDSVGCLQDVHWSMAALGYFPTYTFGNIFAAQLWERMASDLPDRSAMIERGEFKPILDWLREHIHRHGRRYTATELITNLCGEGPSTAPLQAYLQAKAKDVFGM